MAAEPAPAHSYRVQGLGRPLPDHELVRQSRHPNQRARNARGQPVAATQPLELRPTASQPSAAPLPGTASAPTSMHQLSRQPTPTPISLQNPADSQNYLMLTQTMLDNMLDEHVRRQRENGPSVVERDQKGGAEQIEHAKGANGDIDSESSCSSDDEEEDWPNPWARFRGKYLREAFAEFIGVCAACGILLNAR